MGVNASSTVFAQLNLYVVIATMRTVVVSAETAHFLTDVVQKVQRQKKKKKRRARTDVPEASGDTASKTSVLCQARSEEHVHHQDSKYHNQTSTSD